MNDSPLDSTFALLEAGRGRRRITEEALRATVAGLTAVNLHVDVMTAFAADVAAGQ